MATMTIVRKTETGKTYCVMVRKTIWDVTGRPAYVRNAMDLEDGTEVEIDDNFTFEPMFTKEGEPILTKDGQPKHKLVWS